MCSTVASLQVPIISSNLTINGSNLVCTDNLVAEYSVPALPATNYTWSVSGGTIISGDGTNNITVNWNLCSAIPCTGTIRVDYESEFYGCTPGASVLDVEIRDRFSILQGDQTICRGVQGKYFLSNTVNTFLWSLENENGLVMASSSGPVYSPITLSTTLTNSLAPGSYTLVVSDPNNIYCNLVERFFITVAAGPPAPDILNLTGADELVCANTSHAYSIIPSNPNNSINWIVTGGTPLTIYGPNASITWNTSPYTFSITETDVNTGCVSNPLNVTISKKEYVAPLCGQFFQLDGTGIPPDFCSAPTTCVNTIREYELHNFSSFNIDLINWKISPENAGSIVGVVNNTITNIVTLTIQWNNAATPMPVEIVCETFTCGTKNSPDLTFDLNLEVSPVIIITTNPASPVCDNTDVTFNISPSQATGLWEWNLGNSIVTGNANINGLLFNVSIGNVLNTVTYPVTVYLDNNGCRSFAQTTLTVLPGPGVFITTSSTDLCTLPVPLLANTNVAGVTYDWTFNNSPLGLNSATISASNIGAYGVTVTDPVTGCTDADVFIVPDCVPPCSELTTVSIQSFTATHNLECGSVTINGIIDASSVWDHYVMAYGDGDSENNPLPQNNVFTFSHLYAHPGTYTVTITFYNLDGTLCKAFDLIVDVTVTGRIVTSLDCPTAPPDRYNVTFNAVTQTLSPILQHSWLLDGITPYCCTNTFIAGALDNSISHALEAEVTNNTETCVLILGPFNLPVPPGASFTPQTAPFCEEQSVVHFDFIGLTTEVYSAAWSFGDLSSYLPINPGLNIDADRVYEIGRTLPYPITLTVTDRYGCTYTSSEDVVVNDNKLNGEILSVFQNPCPGLADDLIYHELPFTNNIPSITPTAYFWSTSEITPTIKPLQTGQYYLTVYDAPKGCKLELPSFADVRFRNAVPPKIKGDVSYCMEETVYLNGLTSGVTLTSWEIPLNASEVNDNNINTMILTVPAAGTYAVTLFGTSDGCPVQNSINIDVYDVPPVPSLVVDNPPACENQSNILVVNNPLNTNYLITWSNGVVPPNVNSQVVYNSGNYTATYIDPVSGCDAISPAVVIYPIPDFNWLVSGCYDYCIDSILTGNFIIPGSTATYLYWEWQLNGQPINGANGNNQVSDLNLNAAGPGGGPLDVGVSVITLYVVDNNSCTHTSDPVYITVNNCNCIIGMQDQVECMANDMNGVSTFAFEFTFIYDDPTIFNQIAVMNLIPLGTASVTINPVTSIQVGNDIWIKVTGIASCNSSEEACFQFIYTDPFDARYNCEYYFCLDPGCESEPCRWDFDITDIRCTGLDGLGNMTYDFDFTTTSIGAVVNAWYAVPATTAGIVSNLPVTLGAGATTATGHFIDVPPHDVSLCLQINVYDPIKNKGCNITQCEILPQCSGETRASEQPLIVTTGMIIYPNPTASAFAVQYQFAAATGKIEIVDLTGKTILSKSLLQPYGILNFENILLPGVYSVHLVSDKESLTEKLLIIK